MLKYTVTMTLATFEATIFKELDIVHNKAKTYNREVLKKFRCETVSLKK